MLPSPATSLHPLAAPILSEHLQQRLLEEPPASGRNSSFLPGLHGNTYPLSCKLSYPLIWMPDFKQNKPISWGLLHTVGTLNNCSMFGVREGQSLSCCFFHEDFLIPTQPPPPLPFQQKSNFPSVSPQHFVWPWVTYSITQFPHL